METPKKIDHRVLQAIIDITAQGDSDALEHRFAVALSEIAPVKKLSICKLLKRNVIEDLEEVLSRNLIAWKPGADPRKEAPSYECSREIRSIPIDPDLKACLITRETSTQVLEDGSGCLLIPLRSQEDIIGLVMLKSDQDLSSYQALLEGLVKVYENYLTILTESECDTLTQLFNRRTFDQKLKRLLRLQREARKEDLSSGKYQSKRRLEPDSFAWLAIMDIDHFKRVNDTYGHVYGDEVLLSFSQKMKASFRSSDLLFRFGGEEFVVILEPIPNENAYKTFERFRESVASHPFPLVGKVTISIGFARITEEDYPPAILEYADKALYYAKEHGRNRLESYETLIEKGALAAEENSGSIELF